MRTSSTALAIAFLWTISLLSLLIALAGSKLFETISIVTSILAGIGMFALVWQLSGPASEERQVWKLGIGLLGSAVYAIINLLILVGFRSYDELEPWMVSGLAIYGVWLVLDSAFPVVGGYRVSRGLEMAIGIGFLLAFMSMLSLGTIGQISQGAGAANLGMLIAQGIGGGIAYFGFPVWLFVLARRARLASFS